MSKSGERFGSLTKYLEGPEKMDKQLKRDNMIKNNLLNSTTNKNILKF